jgi:hypothetical protein
MKTFNEEVNTSRMIGNNGADFVENESWTGIAYGFQPHNLGCKVTAVTIVDADGNAGTAPSWLNTTLDLDAFIPAGLVGVKKGYITAITVTGGLTMYKDNY